MSATGREAVLSERVAGYLMAEVQSSTIAIITCLHEFTSTSYYSARSSLLPHLVQVQRFAVMVCPSRCQLWRHLSLLKALDCLLRKLFFALFKLTPRSSEILSNHEIGLVVKGPSFVI